MILNEFDLAYVSKRIKEETGVDVILRKVHIDNTIPVTEDNRKMFLDSVVETYVNINNGNITPVDDIDGDIQYQTINSLLDGAE